MKRSVKLSLFLLLAAAFAASVYAAPYWTLYRMKAEIEAHDAEALSRRVDFPALRQHVKAQITAAMSARIALGGAQLHLQLGDMMPAGLVDRMVDSVVSPDGLAALLAGSARVGEGQVQDAPPSASAPAAQAEGRRMRLVLRYHGWNEAVFIRDGEDKDGALIFRRAGLWSWKLAGIDIGMAGLGGLAR